MPPKQLHRTSPAPPACPTFPPYSALLQPPVFGWLFCVVCAVVDWQSSKVTMYYIYISFLSFHSPPQSMGQYLPTRSPPTRLHYNTPPTASANYQVDCCFSSPNGGDLRPEPGPSLYFFVRPILALQLTELATARAHRTSCTWYRPIGSGGAKIWSHGGCCHVNRGQSRWVVGWWQLMLVVVCCGCVLDCSSR